MTPEFYHQQHMTYLRQ